MTESRNLTRKYPIYYLRVHDRRNDSLIGRVVDLTTDGIRLVCDEPIKPGTNLQCKISLPGRGNRSGEVPFDAVTVWTNRDLNPDFYDTGCRLTSATPETTNAINRIIRTATFSS